MTRFQAPRGTRDWYGETAARRRAVIDAGRTLFEAAGYGEIVTPMFEDTAVYARTSGEDSDVVQKEMYTFPDRSGRSLTLRPEGTAGVMRAYLEHGMSRQPQPMKLWYCQPNFRYAAVQRGRLREHYQFGVEVIGSDDPAVDAEIIALQARWLAGLGVDTRLELNSIGDEVCRPAYVERLRKFLDERAGRLCDECRDRRHTNPLRVLDCKEPGCREATADAPRITDFLARTAPPISPPSASCSTPAASPTWSSRGSCAASTTTPARRGSSCRPTSAPSRPWPGAGATTAWPSSSAALPHLASASAAASSA